MGTDPVARTVTSQINAEMLPFFTSHNFKGLHSYHNVYIAKTNRERLNSATTEMEMKKRKKEDWIHKEP